MVPCSDLKNLFSKHLDIKKMSKTQDTLNLLLPSGRSSKFKSYFSFEISWKANYIHPILSPVLLTIACFCTRVHTHTQYSSSYSCKRLKKIWRACLLNHFLAGSVLLFFVWKYTLQTCPSASVDLKGRNHAQLTVQALPPYGEGCSHPSPESSFLKLSAQVTSAL